VFPNRWPSYHQSIYEKEPKDLDFCKGTPPTRTSNIQVFREENEFSVNRGIKGLARCDSDRGVVKTSVLTEHCAGDCVAKHEDAHAQHFAPCCERYGRCVHNRPDVRDRQLCHDTWLKYFDDIDAWTECNAYTAEEKCLKSLYLENCTAKSKDVSEECCQR